MNEAKKLLSEWLNDGNFKTYKELANFLGVAPNTIDVWKQRGKIPEKNILKYTQINNKPPLHVEPTSKTVNVPLLTALVSAGSGIENYDVEIEGDILVPTSYFKTIPNIRELKALRVIGDSMTPTLNDGDIVIIKETIEFHSDGIYVINIGGELRVKRLIRRLDGVEIKSDNPNYGSEFVKNGGFKSFAIIGRVQLEIKRW